MLEINKTLKHKIEYISLAIRSNLDLDLVASVNITFSGR